MSQQQPFSIQDAQSKLRYLLSFLKFVLFYFTIGQQSQNYITQTLNFIYQTKEHFQKTRYVQTVVQSTYSPPKIERVMIKKGHENIIIPQKTKLINGIANLNLHYQFFVCQGNPVFQIYVMMLIGSSKKLVGMCEVNLSHWQQNANHSTISHLLRSPDSNAKIDYDFMYLSSDIKNSNKNLLSITQLQSIKKSMFMKQMQDKNLFLEDENNKLVKQIVNVKKQKNQLLIHREQMNEQFQKNSLEFQKKLRQKQIQLQISENNLNIMKEKMDKIQQIINKYGEQSLKSKIESIFTPKN